jgi:hypothetical protein
MGSDFRVRKANERQRYLATDDEFVMYHQGQTLGVEDSNSPFWQLEDLREALE